MLPDYCLEVSKLSNRITRHLSNELNPLTKGSRMGSSSMYAYDSSHDGAGKGYSIPRNEIEAGSSIGKEDLLNCSLDAWHLMLYEISEEFAVQMQRNFLSMLDTVTKKTGNRKDLKGRCLTFDDVTSAIEMMDGITFGEDGIPNVTIAGTPGTHKAIVDGGMKEPTEEEKSRREEVLKRKKEEADAQKCIRSLAWLSIGG